MPEKKDRQEKAALYWSQLLDVLGVDGISEIATKRDLTGWARFWQTVEDNLLREMIDALEGGDLVLARPVADGRFLVVGDDSHLTQVRPAVVEGWELPEPPICPRANCLEIATPYAHNTGDGWTWGWECPHHGPDGFWADWKRPGLYRGVGEEIKWPFLLDWATGADWEAVGIDLV